MSGAAGMNFSGLSSGATMAISGGYDLTKANKLEKRAGKRPVYNIPTPTLNNQFMAENRAQQGLSDESLMLYKRNNDRSLSDSLDAILKSGGGTGSIAELFDRYGDNNAELALLNDQARFTNQQILMNQNQLMADELDKQWQLNTFDPWKDQMQRIAELRTLGNTKKMGGAAIMGGSGGSGGGGYEGSRGANSKDAWDGRNTRGRLNDRDDYLDDYEFDGSQSILNGKRSSDGNMNSRQSNIYLDYMYENGYA